MRVAPEPGPALLSASEIDSLRSQLKQANDAALAEEDRRGHRVNPRILAARREPPLKASAKTPSGGTTIVGDIRGLGFAPPGLSGVRARGNTPSEPHIPGIMPSIATAVAG